MMCTPYMMHCKRIRFVSVQGVCHHWHGQNNQMKDAGPRPNPVRPHQHAWDKSAPNFATASPTLAQDIPFPWALAPCIQSLSHSQTSSP